MIDLSKHDLKVTVFVLIAMVEGLLKVCDQNDIEVGNIEFDANGKREEFPFKDVLGMIRDKCNAPNISVTAEQRP